jgi:hypothetical protein
MSISGSRGSWCLCLGLVGVGLAVLGIGLAIAARGGSQAFGEVAFPLPPAQPAAGIGITATPLGDSEVIVSLVDRTRERLLVYQVDVKRGRMKLLAARDISADWLLTDWNNDPPLPKDIRTRVEKGAEAGRPAPAGETPKPGASP